MLETPHVLVAAAIAVKIGNPVLAIPLTLASHFVLDKVPHWNPHLNSEIKKYGKLTPKSTAIVAVDSAIALVSGSAIAASVLPDYGLAVTVLVCCLFSVLPDLIEAPYYFMHMRNPWIKRWIAFQRSIQENTDAVWGLTSQTIISLTALWWMLG